MNHLYLLLTGLCFFVNSWSQNLIGLKKQQVEQAVMKLYPTFTEDNSFVNNSYKYLKFIDKFNEQTLLVFLSDNDECTSTKLICDYSMLDQVKSDLKKFKTTGKDEWNYRSDGVEYVIKLRRDEWFFSLITSKKE